ncbi:predicted protein [Histoplasma mississippiense (nom. inval.)]|uniref:predicted protein n=1 Tax=Ajellomyces capsulatus (strain NAm1 / WU24) TaxID=2059318 RepID=UPI000157CFC3|nr:predicted protein [Histoplasma mississippiense (nom. inval.)]EDN11415.1 predicted protein [Histoplasma mississippiense (nom. inval.)]
MHHEAVIQAAIDDLNLQLVPNYTTTAKKYGISRHTLSRCYNNLQVSGKEAISIHCKNLSNSQEEQLLFHINQLADRGFPCTPQILHNLIVEILKVPVGVNWVTRFCPRRKDLQAKIAQYNIEPGNIYNFNEKGFLLGLIHTLKRIVSITALKSGRVIGASQNGS